MSAFFVIPLLILSVAALGIISNTKLTINAAQGRRILLWKTSCLASSLFRWSLILVALEFVIYLIWYSSSTSNKFEEQMIGYAIASPFFAYLFALLSQTPKKYWKAIVDSLESCNSLSQSQKDNLRFEKNILIGGTAEQRKIALRKILFPAEAVVVIENSRPQDRS